MWITGCENGVYVEVDTIKGTHTGCPKAVSYTHLTLPTT